MKKSFILFIIFVATVIIITASLMHYFFFSMNNLPTGELLGRFDSTNGSYTLNLYRVNGGATTNYSLRGELVDNRSKSPKNIYWGYREKKAVVVWINDYTVVINDRQLDVRNETYDWRKNKN